jgi:hypothetical protein
MGEEQNVVNMECKNPEFSVHKLNDQGMENAQKIQAAFDLCLNTLKGICIDGRHMSIVRTKMEEACFFAKKAMAIYNANQKLD